MSWGLLDCIAQLGAQLQDATFVVPGVQDHAWRDKRKIASFPPPSHPRFGKQQQTHGFGIGSAGPAAGNELNGLLWTRKAR